jgi:hypothetical protein
MPAEIHFLTGQPTPIGRFIRVGHTGHRQLEALHGSGRIHLPQVVIDAAQMDTQRDLIEILQAGGTEIVLDTHAAELSSRGRFDGSVQNVPWANARRPLQPSDFKGARGREIVEKIADFAVERGIDTVLAPAHLLKGPTDEWMKLDVTCCELLRSALDSAGGAAISIDYPLIISSASLRDAAQRRAFTRALPSPPFQNIWLRVSGFGADATAVGIRRFISNVADFHSVGKAIIADCVGGLAGLAIVSFGAASGIAHGVAEKERFESNSWNKPRDADGGGGQHARLYVPGLDRFLKIRYAEMLMNLQGGRRLLACHDRECCALGYDDSKSNPKLHFLIQRSKQIVDIERTHQDRRVSRFIEHHLVSADRTARQVAQLRPNDSSLRQILHKASTRLDRMRAILEDLEETMGSNYTRAAPIQARPTVLARYNRKGE